MIKLKDMINPAFAFCVPIKEDKGDMDNDGVNEPDDKEFIEQYCKFLNLNQAPNLTFAIPFCYFRMAAILQGVKKRALDGNASNPTHGLKMGKYIKEYAIKGLESINRNFI